MSNRIRVEDSFALVVGSIADYVYDNTELLLTKSLFSGKTAALIQKEGIFQPGVKSSERILLMTTDAIFQDGTGCVRTSSGSTTLTQRLVTVGTISVVEDICVPDIEKKYLGFKLKGANAQTLPFEADYANYKALAVARQLEIDAWVGDLASGVGQTNKFDGLIKIIDNSGVSILSNNGTWIPGAGTGIVIATGITTANVKAIVDSVWLALPSDIMGKEDIRIFCGWDVFNIFISAFRDQNLFNFAPTGKEVDSANGEVTIPGTNYKLTAVHGLDSTKRLFGVRMSNLVLATDMDSDFERFTMKPDQFDEYLHFKMRFRFGVQVAFPDQVATFKLV